MKPKTSWKLINLLNFFYKEHIEFFAILILILRSPEGKIILNNYLSYPGQGSFKRKDTEFKKNK